jgi:hypothetical protein
MTRQALNFASLSGTRGVVNSVVARIETVTFETNYGNDSWTAKYHGSAEQFCDGKCAAMRFYVSFGPFYAIPNNRNRMNR